jgi:hypothetical protein
MTAPTTTIDFRNIVPGIERVPGCSSLPRHRHLHPYATVVLAGCFDESSYAGRIRAVAGDVLIHPAVDCHANWFISSTVTLVRLDWADVRGKGAFYRLDDVDELAILAEKDPQEAALLLESVVDEAPSTPLDGGNDWPDLLVQALTRNPALELGVWAQENDRAPETVSRGFNAAYGVAPAVFRAESRARDA